MTTLAPRTDVAGPQPSGSPARRLGSALAAPLWRWHFYAGFLVVPVLALLAVTGLLLLFGARLEPLLHPDLLRVSAPADLDPLPYRAQQRRAEDLVRTDPGLAGGRVEAMVEPSGPTSPTRFAVALPDGSTRDVLVDPYRGLVLGSLDPEATLSGTAARLHGDLSAGPLGDAVLELGTCWAIVLTLTGYYLVVRGRGVRRRAVQRARAEAGRPDAARLLRNGRHRQRHAFGGAVIGLALLGMLTTGLPWTGWWGGHAEQLAVSRGTSFWPEDPGTGTGAGTGPAGAGAGAGIDVDAAVRAGVGAGLVRPLTVALHEGDEGTFSVLGAAVGDPTAAATVHLDRAGVVTSTYGYADYPALARVVAQGSALHEGRRFGVVGQAALAAFCVFVLVMCVSGPLMWWRRRPGTGQAARPVPTEPPPPTSPWLLVPLVALAVLLPLFGLSLVVVLLLDQLVLRRLPVLRRWFG